MPAANEIQAPASDIRQHLAHDNADGVVTVARSRRLCTQAITEPADASQRLALQASPCKAHAGQPESQRHQCARLRHTQDLPPNLAAGELRRVEIQVGKLGQQVGQLRGQRCVVAFGSIPLPGDSATDTRSERRDHHVGRIAVIEWRAEEAEDHRSIHTRRRRGVDVRGQKVVVRGSGLRARQIQDEDRDRIRQGMNRATMEKVLLIKALAPAVMNAGGWMSTIPTWRACVQSAPLSPRTAGPTCREASICVDSGLSREASGTGRRPHALRALRVARSR